MVLQQMLLNMVVAAVAVLAGLVLMLLMVLNHGVLLVEEDLVD